MDARGIFLFILLISSPALAQEAALKPAPSPQFSNPNPPPSHYTIKLATTDPADSVVGKTLSTLANALQSESQEGLELVLYPAGTMGDEDVVLSKMRTGQLSAALLSSGTLAKIVPDIRVLELPMLFKDYKTLDYVLLKLFPQFEQQLDQQGLVLLGWVDRGFTQIFSNQAIRSTDDLKGKRWWVEPGDPLSEEMGDFFGVSPTPLARASVLLSLHAHTTDALNCPPIDADQLQWDDPMSSMTQISFADSFGAVVIEKADFMRLPADLRILLKHHSRTAAELIVTKLRMQTAHWLEQPPLSVVNPGPQEAAEWEQVALKMRKAAAGKYFSQGLLDQIEQWKSEASPATPTNLQRLSSVPSAGLLLPH